MDLFTTDEKVDLLFKKLLNKPATVTSRSFFQEPNIVNRPVVYQEDVLSSPVPSVVPSDLRDLTDTSLDDNGYTLKGSYAGKTSSSDPNIRYYHKVQTEYMQGTNGACFQAVDAQTSHPQGYADGVNSANYGQVGTFGRVLQKSIPFNYATDGSYCVLVYKDDESAIPYGSAGGGFFVEDRAGIVNFYQVGNVTGVSEAHPVLVSFYKYVGPYGGVSSSQVNEFVTTQENDFTKKQVFTGGLDGATNDSLSAIQIDDRNLNELSDGALLDCLQFGGNFANSWRIIVQKATSGSRFSVQCRDGQGTWITKSTFASP